MGGKQPSEYNGCNCSVCNVRLPPCKDWDGFTKQHVDREVDTVYCYVFLGGRYYRPIGGNYFCPTCFFKPREDYRKQLEENRKREEQRRKEEEERIKREEEQRRQEEERKKELQRREEEAKKEKERQEQLKREQEQREAERRRKQEEFEKQTASKEALADRFATWALDKETREHVRKEVRAQNEHGVTAVPHSDANIDYEELYGEEYELWSDEDLYLEDEDSSYQYDGDLTPEEVTTKVINMVQAWVPEEGEEIDVPWLKIAQTQLVSNYASIHDLSDMEVETLTYCISMIRYKLSDLEMLDFTKLLCLVARSHPLDYEKTATTLDDELAGRFMILLLTTALNNGFIYKECSNECVRLLASMCIKDEELAKLISETKSKFWNANDWLVFMEKCDEVQLSYTDQKKIMVLLQAYDISPVVINSALELGNNITAIMAKLDDYIENEPNTHLVDLLKEIRSTKLIDDATMDKVEDITTKTKAILDSFNIHLDFEQRLSSDLAQAKSLFSRCGSGNTLNHSQLASALTTMCAVIKKSQGYCPRDTQLVTLTILIVSDNTSVSRLLEVMTGEGKSTVIAMFAAILALQGKKVDIITSSPILALRDAEDWESFYALLGLSATHNTDIGAPSLESNPDERRRRTYTKPIIYGTLGNFAADILREEFEQKSIRSGRMFDTVIADEVDLLMLDEGVQFTYLSHSSPILHHLQPVIGTVWAVIGQYIPVISTIGHAFYMGGAKLFTEIIFETINPEICSVEDSSQFLMIANQAGLIDEQTVNKLTYDDGQGDQDEISESKKEAMATITNDTIIAVISKLEEYLPYHFEVYEVNDFGQPDPCYTSDISDEEATLPEDEQLPVIRMLLLDNALACTLSNEAELKEGTTAKIEANIEFTDTPDDPNSTEGQPKLQIPEFLRELVLNQLPEYIGSAFRCLEMVENREYTINSDNKIIPVDFLNSGVMQLNKKWGQGLQQMLEMKHHLCVSSMSVVTNFMSHVELFTRYKDSGMIYGLSGTLGMDSPDTAKLLRELFEVRPCTIPTFKHRKLFENPAMIVEGAKIDWYNKIMEVIDKAVKQETWRHGRAVLVLCEDIKTAKDFRAHVVGLDNWSEDKVHLYAHSDSNELQAIKHKFSAGEIVIATNLAGRGTNIKLTDEVNKSGGLLCLVTFLARNRRVELQAFGRTARKGKPGSVQCVLHASNLAPQYRGLSITGIRETRAQGEENRLDMLMNTEVKEVQVKETLFKIHCSYLKQTYDSIVSRSDKAITLDSINESWGQWLLMKREQIEGLQLDDLRTQIGQTQSSWPNINFYHQIKYGNTLIKYDEEENAGEAYNYYTKSINQESTYGAIAYYNRAYVTIVKSDDGYMDKAMADLEEAEKRLMPYISEVGTVMQCASVVNTVQKRKPPAEDDGDEEPNILNEQMEVRMQIFGFVRDKINEAIGKIKGFKESGDDIEAVPLGVFSLIPDADYATNQELYGLWHLGMEVVFDVKKKPRFCWEGLVVMLLGIAQIIAGVALAVLTCGAAANFGMGLIAEGVSDCIDGVIAMATGEFSWAEWGISKAIGIAASLVSGGVAKFATKGFKAVKLASKLGKNLKQIPKMAKSTWGVAAKQNFKNVAKHVGKEMVEQAVMRAVGYGQHAALKLLYDKIGDACKAEIIGDLKQSFTSGYLRDVVQKEFISKLPESYASENKMSPVLKQRARKFFDEISQAVVQTLMSDGEIQGYVTEASLTLLSRLTEKHSSGKAFYEVLEAAAMGALVTKAIADVGILLNKLTPETENICREFLEGVSSTGDLTTNASLSCGTDLKNELAEFMGDTYGDLVSASLQQNLGAVANRRVYSGVNRIGNKHLKKLLRSSETEAKVKAGQKANYIRSMDPARDGGLPDVARSMVKGYATKVTNVNRAGSILEMKVAAEHYKQGVTIYQEKNGKYVKHSSIDPSTSDGSPNVKLLYTPPKNKDGIGHYDLLVNNKVIKITSDDSNCLFQAYATGRNPQNQQVGSDALDVRRAVADEINKNPGLWAEHVTHRLELTRIRTGERFALLGAGKKNDKTKVHPDTFDDMIHNNERHTMYTQANGVEVVAVKRYKKNLATDANDNLQSADGTRETALDSMETTLTGMNLATNVGRCHHTLPVSGMPKRKGGKAPDSAVSYHIGPSEAGANAGNAYGNAVMTSTDLNKKERTDVWDPALKKAVGNNDFTVKGKVTFEPLVPANFNQFFTDLNTQRTADGKVPIHNSNKNVLQQRLQKFETIDDRGARVSKIDYEITDSTGTVHKKSLGRDLNLFVPESYTKANQKVELPGENLAVGASKPKVKYDKIGHIPGRKHAPNASAAAKRTHDGKVKAYKKKHGIP